MTPGGVTKMSHGYHTRRQGSTQRHQGLDHGTAALVEPTRAKGTDRVRRPDHFAARRPRHALRAVTTEGKHVITASRITASKTRRAAALATCAVAAITGPLAAAPAQAKSAAPTALSVCAQIVSDGFAVPLCYADAYYYRQSYEWPVTELRAAHLAAQIRFYEHTDGSGWTKCYTGGSSYTIATRYQDPAKIVVTDNKASC